MDGSTAAALQHRPDSTAGSWPTVRSSASSRSSRTGSSWSCSLGYAVVAVQALGQLPARHRPQRSAQEPAEAAASAEPEVRDLDRGVRRVRSTPMQFPSYRPRRLRANATIRSMVRETSALAGRPHLPAVREAGHRPQGRDQVDARPVPALARHAARRDRRAQGARRPRRHPLRPALREGRGRAARPTTSTASCRRPSARSRPTIPSSTSSPTSACASTRATATAASSTTPAASSTTSPSSCSPRRPSPTPRPAPTWSPRAT